MRLPDLPPITQVGLRIALAILATIFLIRVATFLCRQYAHTPHRYPSSLSTEQGTTFERIRVLIGIALANVDCFRDRSPSDAAKLAIWTVGDEFDYRVVGNDQRMVCAHHSFRLGAYSRQQGQLWDRHEHLGGVVDSHARCPADNDYLDRATSPVSLSISYGHIRPI